LPCPPGPRLRHRLHEWFDGKRTLKYLHALRGSELPSLPWREALALSPWFALPSAGLAHDL
jgi:hypothetical protein